MRGQTAGHASAGRSAFAIHVNGHSRNDNYSGCDEQRGRGGTKPIVASAPPAQTCRNGGGVALRRRTTRSRTTAPRWRCWRGDYYVDRRRNGGDDGARR